MRILIGEFAHEGNSFADATTSVRSFEERELLDGEAIIAAHRGHKTALGGFLAAIEKEGSTAVPSIAASALPSGPIAAETFNGILGRLLKSIEAAMPFDGVLLSLHGSMIVEEKAGIGDPEGTIVQAVRKLIGDHTPFIVTMDPHSDTSDLLISCVDVSLAYNEEPHRDAFDRGVEAGVLMGKMLRHEIHPIAFREHPPMVITGTHTTTDQGPMRAVYDLREKLEQEPGVLDISVHFGFFGADQRESGLSVVCTADGDADLARRMAKEVAAFAWENRETFIPVMVDARSAVADALKSGIATGLVDECDDPAGGGSAESVTLLRAMIECGVKHGTVSTVHDAPAARRLAEVGEGKVITIELGCKTDKRAGEPITVTGTVAQIRTAPIHLDHWSERTYDAGIIAVLDVGGILVAITERKVVSENIDLFEILGWDVSKCQVAGFKGLGGHIRQVIGPKLKQYVRIDGVGATHRDLRKVGPYKHIARPIWPLDDVSSVAYPRVS